MESYCGTCVSGLIGSQQFPWADLDQKVCEDAQASDDMDKDVLPQD